MESRSLLRLLGALVTGVFIFALVMGSVFLTQVDTTLMVQRPTYSVPMPTTTLYPTFSPLTSAVPQTPAHSPSPTSTPCPYPQGWQPYEVQVGETLALLVQAARTSIAALMKANCLVVAELHPGDIIYLPPDAFVTPTPVMPRCGPPPTWRIVYVQRGDTLYNLASRYATTVEAIRQANCLVDERIYIGQALYLPPVVVVPPTATRTPWPSPTPSPTLTPTPEITATPPLTPTETLSPTPPMTDTPIPTITDTPIPTVTPTPTLEPTEPIPVTATPTVTPLPPTDTPTPPATEVPTPLPPTETPAPSSTPTTEG